MHSGVIAPCGNVVIALRPVANREVRVARFASPLTHSAGKSRKKSSGRHRQRGCGASVRQTAGLRPSLSCTRSKIGFLVRGLRAGALTES